MPLWRFYGWKVSRWFFFRSLDTLICFYSDKMYYTMQLFSYCNFVRSWNVLYFHALLVKLFLIEIIQLNFATENLAWNYEGFQKRKNLRLALSCKPKQIWFANQTHWNLLRRYEEDENYREQVCDQATCLESSDQIVISIKKNRKFWWSLSRRFAIDRARLGANAEGEKRARVDIRNGNLAVLIIIDIGRADSWIRSVR